MGYGSNVMVNCLKNNINYKMVETRGIAISDCLNMIFMKGALVYDNGKFATIVKEEPKYTVDEIIEAFPMLSKNFVVSTLREQFKA
jgi:hypothetical protein